MAYSDFTLDVVTERFALTFANQPLFSEVARIPAPDWLTTILNLAMPQALASEKSRSEFIIAPILTALRERNRERIAIYSGQTLNVSAADDLGGECDFLIGSPSAFPVIRAPILTVLEAKKSDVDGGWGQCIAQMVGAQRYNENHNETVSPLFGCITTGETWQFLQIVGQIVTIAPQRIYIADLPSILGTLQSIVDAALSLVSSGLEREIVAS